MNEYTATVGTSMNKRYTFYVHNPIKICTTGWKPMNIFYINM